jgi:TonB family protein
MDFDSWTNRIVDVERRRRLTLGYFVGVVATSCVGAALAFATPPEIVEEEEPNILDVALVEEPEPEIEAEPEPEPEPEPAAPEPPLQAPVVPEIETPEEIPDAAPVEAEPTAAPDEGGDPFAQGGAVRGPARTPREAVVAEAPVPVPVPIKPSLKPKSGPIRMSAETEPPRELGVASGVGAYPASAKAAGIEGTVVVRFVIDSSGQPSQVKSLRGPVELRPACEARVNGTKYSPAKDRATGQAVSVFHHKRCVFRIKT